MTYNARINDADCIQIFMESMRDLEDRVEEIPLWDEYLAKDHEEAARFFQLTWNAKGVDPEDIGMAVVWDMLAGLDEPPWRALVNGERHLYADIAYQTKERWLSHADVAYRTLEDLCEALQAAAASTSAFLLWHRQLRILPYPPLSTPRAEAGRPEFRDHADYDYLCHVLNSIDNDAVQYARVPQWDTCYAQLIERVSSMLSKPKRSFGSQDIAAAVVWRALVSENAPLWRQAQRLNLVAWPGSIYHDERRKILHGLTARTLHVFSECEGTDKMWNRYYKTLDEVAYMAYSYLRKEGKVPSTPTCADFCGTYDDINVATKNRDQKRRMEDVPDSNRAIKRRFIAVPPQVEHSSQDWNAYHGVVARGPAQVRHVARLTI
ncbi:hypothetical protein PUNSTDRAFT_145922 [Punctularia strigosozonata HHB-11173 SS5]|uniref:uncharacterized protein n=1 Tax=Punctularia strigosozonata (strain HHB-11173) TaxID=741275 RepID=UPI0004417736|nr:uncharacterized protein PUNSTDRAFT_145922 [Punctularia strigosozonata HHB-11173 SS5]EIN05506.1 hypothetical protein PUNSTDRAFT_145922 [Punctularia strigosozonata HHB-11173 SS5]